MLPAARSRRCSRYLVWASVFAISAVSSAFSVSIIVCAWYLLLLSFSSLKLYIGNVLQSSTFEQADEWLMSRVFAIGLGDRGFNPRASDTKDSKMVLDSALLNTQHYKVGIKGKVKKSRE